MYCSINRYQSIWMVIILVLISVTSSIHCLADIAVYSVSTHQEIDGGYLSSTSRFGPRIPIEGFVGMVVYSNPPLGCSEIQPPPVHFKNPTRHWILLVSRGNCTFEQKIRYAQDAYYNLVIIHNNSSEIQPIYVANRTGINISSVLVNKQVGLKFKQDYQYYNNVYISIDDNTDFPFDLNADLLIPFAVVVSVCTITMITLMICKCIRDRRRARRYRLPASSLKRIPVEKFSKGSPYETCAICLDDYIDGEKLRILPCAHAYHTKCIDPWLTRRRRVCPICKRKVFAADETPINDSESDSDTDNDERTPLVRAEPVSQQPLSGRSSILVRERLLAHLRMARSVRRVPNHSPGRNSDESNTSSNNDGNVMGGNTIEHPHPAHVVNSVNSVDNDSILDISPSSSVYSYSSNSQAHHSGDSQYSLNNGYKLLVRNSGQSSKLPQKYADIIHSVITPS